MLGHVPKGHGGSSPPSDTQLPHGRRRIFAVGSSGTQRPCCMAAGDRGLAFPEQGRDFVGCDSLPGPVTHGRCEVLEQFVLSDVDVSALTESTRSEVVALR